MPQLLRVIRDEMKKFPRDPNKDYPRLGVRKIESKVWAGTKSIMYKGVVLGETSKYPVIVQFFGIKVESNKTKTASVPAKVDGKLWYHDKPSVRKHQVSLKCGCQDFRFTWEFQLHKNKALIGNFRKYTPVPGSNRPPRNPKDLMGYCKHIHSMLLALKDSEVVTE